MKTKADSQLWEILAGLGITVAVCACVATGELIWYTIQKQQQEQAALRARHVITLTGVKQAK